MGSKGLFEGESFEKGDGEGAKLFHGNRLRSKVQNGLGLVGVASEDRLYALHKDYGDILLKDFDDVRVAGKVIGKLKRR